MGWPHLRWRARRPVKRQGLYLLWPVRVWLVPACISCPSLLAGRPAPVAGMEYPHGTVAAGGISFNPVVDSGWLKQHGIDVGGRATDDADACPRDSPSSAGQTARRSVALYSATGTRLGSC